MKKVCIVVAGLLLLFLAGFRIYSVNTREYLQYYPEKAVYDMGTPIPMNTGLYYFATHDNDGYFVEVEGTQLLSMDAFLAENDQTEAYPADNGIHDSFGLVCLVDVTIFYDSTADPSEKIVDLYEFRVVGPDFYCQFSPELNRISKANRVLQGNSSFAITSGKPLHLQLPFLVATQGESAITEEYFRKSEPKLLVTYYPVESYGVIM